jgi:hypothetical protein
MVIDTNIEHFLTLEVRIKFSSNCYLYSGGLIENSAVDFSREGKVDKLLI